jgi:hypothetical protein
VVNWGTLAPATAQGISLPVLDDTKTALVGWVTHQTVLTAVAAGYVGGFEVSDAERVTWDKDDAPGMTPLRRTRAEFGWKVSAGRFGR